MKHRTASPSSGVIGRDHTCLKGAAIVAMAAITTSGTFIFSKLLTERLPVPVFTALWFGVVGTFGLTVYLLRCRARRDIDARWWGVLSALQSFLVILYSWGLFGTLPTSHPIIGGTLAVVGAIVVVTGSRAVRSRNQQA